MKNKKDIKKASLLTLATSLFTLGNINQSSAQMIIAEVISDLNLRSGPSTNYPVLLNIKKGSSIKILESGTEWSKIQYLNEKGYIPSNFLNIKFTKKNATTKQSSYTYKESKFMKCDVDILHIYFGPNNHEKVLGSLTKGDTVEVLYDVNNWARIHFNKKYGYVKLSSLSYTQSLPITSINNSKLMVPTIDCLNILDGPSPYENVIYRINKNDKVEVVYHVSNGWSKIKYKSKIGYADTNYLTYI
ncbi:MAG: SH3 domain-containing protein [Peptostreptococcaceae bacterium]